MREFDVTHMQKYMSKYNAKCLGVILRNGIKYTNKRGLNKHPKGGLVAVTLSKYDINDAINYVNTSARISTDTREKYLDVLETIKQDLEDYMIVPDTSDEFVLKNYVNDRVPTKYLDKDVKKRKREAFLKKWNEYVANNKIFKEKENS